MPQDKTGRMETSSGPYRQRQGDTEQQSPSIEVTRQNHKADDPAEDKQRPSGRVAANE